MVKVGLLVSLEAKPGKESALAEFLASALPLANQEVATPVWFALRMEFSLSTTNIRERPPGAGCKKRVTGNSCRRPWSWERLLDRARSSLAASVSAARPSSVREPSLRATSSRGTWSSATLPDP